MLRLKIYCSIFIPSCKFQGFSIFFCSRIFSLAKILSLRPHIPATPTAYLPIPYPSLPLPFSHPPPPSLVWFISLLHDAPTTPAFAARFFLPQSCTVQQLLHLRLSLVLAYFFRLRNGCVLVQLSSPRLFSRGEVEQYSHHPSPPICAKCTVVPLSDLRQTKSTCLPVLLVKLPPHSLRPQFKKPGRYVLIYKTTEYIRFSLSQCTDEKYTKNDGGSL